MNFKKNDKDRKETVYENGHLVYYMMAVRFAVIFVLLAAILAVSIMKATGKAYIISAAIGIVELCVLVRCISYISLGNKCRALKKNK